MGSRTDYSELGVILSYKPGVNNQEVFQLANYANNREHSAGDICPWELWWPMSVLCLVSKRWWVLWLKMNLVAVGWLLSANGPIKTCIGVQAFNLF